MTLLLFCYTIDSKNIYVDILQVGLFSSLHFFLLYKPKWINVTSDFLEEEELIFF